MTNNNAFAQVDKTLYILQLLSNHMNFLMLKHVKERNEMKQKKETKAASVKFFF